MVIAIASILVAVGMKTYANFQKWAMWIGLAGVIVCGILLLVTSGDSFKQKFNDAANKYYGGDKGMLNLQKYETDESGYFVYDDTGLAIKTVEGRDVPRRVHAARGGRLWYGHADLDVLGRPELGHLDAHPVHDVLDGVAELGGDPLRRGPRGQGLPQEHLPDARRAPGADAASPSPSLG